MELRTFAARCLLAALLEEKLARADDPFTDDTPGEPQRFQQPGRPAELSMAPRRTAPALPSPTALRDPRKRGVAHHILANHELQALEVMAWVLLAFPEAPADFRRGVAEIMGDEQRHTRMHVERADRLGVRFGSLPVNGYIWKQGTQAATTLEYCACLPLLFEGRNLDHSLELATAFGAAGDARSAAIMETIHRDEIRHVAFGLEWLRKFKPPGVNDWDAFAGSLHWPMRPGKGRGDVFQRTAREQAGMDAEFIARLEVAGDEE